MGMVLIPMLLLLLLHRFLASIEHLQLLFSLGLVSNRYLLVASIKTQVLELIFSFIIKRRAELSTVFKICACNPLKNPNIPSFLHIELTTPGTVRQTFWRFSFVSSSCAAWIITLHLYAEKKSSPFQHASVWRMRIWEFWWRKKNYAPDCRICQNGGNAFWNCTDYKSCKSRKDYRRWTLFWFILFSFEDVLLQLIKYCILQ